MPDTLTSHQLSPLETIRFEILRLESGTESYDGVAVLDTDFDTRATVLVHSMGSYVLLHEECHYGPLPYHALPFSYDETGTSYPFQTVGTRWRVDANTGMSSQQDFTAQENQIQGLAYALEAAKYGGNLRPTRAVQYIVDLSKEGFRDNASTMPVEESVVQRLRLQQINHITQLYTIDRTSQAL